MGKYCCWLFVFFLISLGSVAQTNMDESVNEEIAKPKSVIFIKLLFDNPKFEKGQKHIFQMSGTSFIGKGGRSIDEESSLNQIRLSKGGESLKLVEEKIIENKDDASDYVIESIGQNSITVLEKVDETIFKIRKYQVIYKEQEEM